MEVHPSPHFPSIQLRTHSSDVMVFDQVFYHEEYKPIAALRDVQVIIDCGANIGCTSVYLLERYPNAQLIAVEPDTDNAQIRRHNLDSYGKRAKVINAGIWSREASLRVERGNYRDGLEWSFQVRECIPGEQEDVKAVSIPWIMKQNCLSCIDILKVDIEGAEKRLFSNGCLSWLKQVGCLAIEVHDQESHEIVANAINQLPFDKIKMRETMFCFRRMP